MATRKQPPTFRLKLSLPKKAPSLQTIPNNKIITAAFILNGVTLGALLLLQRFIPPQIPLFYGLAEGEDQLAPSLGILIPSLAATAIGIVNALIALFIRNEYIQQVLILAAFSAGLLALVTTVKIFMLVGSF